MNAEILITQFYVKTELVEKIYNHAPPNQLVPQDIICVLIKPVLSLVITKHSKNAQMIKCSNVKIKLVPLNHLIVEPELLVLKLIWSFVQIKHVHSLNYNVDNHWVVIKECIFVQINLVHHHSKIAHHL